MHGRNWPLVALWAVCLLLGAAAPLHAQPRTPPSSTLVRGQVVRELAGGGSQGIPWDGRNAAGRTVPPGVYFVRMANGDEIHDVRVVRVR